MAVALRLLEFIAGKSEQLVGIAPGTKLLSFKVFGDSGYSNEETVIERSLKAFESGVDIISASLGGNSGFTPNAWAVLASRMAEKGVVISIAAGNEGDSDPFDASNGASGKNENVITVGATEPGTFPAQAFSEDFKLDGQSNKTHIVYIPSAESFLNIILGWPIKPVSLDSSVNNDACNPLPGNTASFNGTILLARIGGCEISVKRANIPAFGAQYILFYNDDKPYQGCGPTTPAASWQLQDMLEPTIRQSRSSKKTIPNPIGRIPRRLAKINIYLRIGYKLEWYFELFKETRVRRGHQPL
ncbi:peptidase S8/S53 domain-containing protein [Daldinia caldariorum]|uniref:peptidase S8/S53 domain-containing protein n=1 Tax=Daldinia caldariorum TaxID=326644 RepID=UPI0020078D10|nr:peptidase S8/S53 domain-containing protein [Daldinia caldariorum]KAI1466273.1 peptidase S8/S53 domain-containing protein [Daldinia caldariorum]